MSRIINLFKEKKYDILFILAAILYISGISGYYDYIFLNLNKFSVRLCQIIAYILIITGFIYSGKLLKGLYEKKENYIRFTSIFWIYFAVNIIIYFLTNGGLYNADESNIIYNASSGYLKDAVAHYLTIIYYMISFFIFPFIKSTLLLHIITISSVVAYIYTKLTSIYKIKYNFIWLIPFFLPPVLRMNIQPLRSVLYYPFFLLLFAYLFFKMKEEKNLTNKEIILSGILSALICIWRNENIFLLFILPFVLKFLLDKFITLKQLFLYFLILISLTCFSHVQTEKYGYAYKTLAIVRPLFKIVNTDFKSNNKEDDLKKISKVFNIEDYKNIYDDDIIFVESYSSEMNQENVRNLIPIYGKLLIYNFDIYLKDRIRIIKTYTCFLRDSVYIYNNPNDKKEKILNLLEFRNRNNEPTVLSYIVYNIFVPYIILIITMIYGIIKRKKYQTCISAILILLTTLICATCAEQFFHYYIHCYITGYFFLCFYISLAINEKTS